MIDKIRCETCVGNDIHKELIAMWLALQNGWKPPPHITEEEYLRVRDNKEKYPDYYVGYVGFHATFGSRYYGGYARSFKSDGVTPRDQSNEAYRNTMKQVPKIQDVVFTSGDYRDNEYSGIQNAVIYCDPPYSGSTGYGGKTLDYGEFWEWCRKKSEDNYVFVNEYNAPEDFRCVWSKESMANFDSGRKNKDKDKKIRVEKLFVCEGGLSDRFMHQEGN